MRIGRLAAPIDDEKVDKEDIVEAGADIVEDAATVEGGTWEVATRSIPRCVEAEEGIVGGNARAISSAAIRVFLWIFEDFFAVFLMKFEDRRFHCGEVLGLETKLTGASRSKIFLRGGKEGSWTESYCE